MSNIQTNLLSMVENLHKKLSLPACSRLFIPRMTASQHSENKYAKFGVLLLEDDSCGFFYALADETLSDVEQLMEINQLSGSSPVSIAKWYADESVTKRSIGMAAINAISDHIFRQSQFIDRYSAKKPAKRTKPEHLGMVGFFPPLVAKFRESGQKLTVLEQNPDFVEKSGNLQVTLDAKKLFECDEVLCTASTLLNGSLQEILDSCNSHAYISLIGPTAGCLPDALFARGIDSIGASRVVNLKLLLKRMENAESWGDAVEKYTLNRHDYPGYEALLT